jgi:hypothetical protein
MKIKNTFKNNGRRVVGLFMSVKPRTKIEKIFELPKKHPHNPRVNA